MATVALWNDFTQYITNDVVQWFGDTYTATQNSLDEIPQVGSAYWSLPPVPSVPVAASYSSSVSQPVLVPDVPQAFTYNTTQFNQGTTLVSNSRVTVSVAGNYTTNYNIQLFNTSGGTLTATVFYKVNGVIKSNTGARWSIPNNATGMESNTNIFSLSAGDYVEVFFAAGNILVSARATPVGLFVPSAIPSIVFNITEILNT